jgi:hypothetical protein
MVAVGRLVDGSQLIDEQPAAVDALVRLGEFVWRRSRRQSWRRSVSSASPAARTTWKGSAQTSALLARARITSGQAPCMSAETASRRAQPSSPSSSKNACRTARLLPGRAQTIRPLSWQTTQSRYRRPLR